MLALRDESTPYRLKIDATIGRSGVQADNNITNLIKFSAIDMRLALRGDSLAQLFPLVNIAFPKTQPHHGSSDAQSAEVALRKFFGSHRQE